MKKQINPAILENSTQEVIRQVNALQSVCAEFDIDVIDWQRREVKTLPANEILALNLHTKLNFDLQMDDPRSTVNLLLDAKQAHRIIINLESDYPIQPILNQIKQDGIEAGISLNPGNKVFDILEYIPYCDFIQIMTIEPGIQGSTFIPSRLGLAFELRNVGYDGPIGIDGGINLQTIKQVNNYPIQYVSVGSALSQAQMPAEAYLELLALFH